MSRACACGSSGSESNLADIQEMMVRCESKTAKNTRLNLSVAVNFGGRWDIVNAAETLAQQVASGTLLPEDVNENAFAGRDEPNRYTRARSDDPHRR